MESINHLTLMPTLVQIDTGRRQILEITWRILARMEYPECI